MKMYLVGGECCAKHAWLPTFTQRSVLFRWFGVARNAVLPLLLASAFLNQWAWAEDANLKKSATPAPNPGTGFINLLPLIDPKQDSVAGKWEITANGIASSGIGEERIEIPYQPPAEYDFKIGFTKLSGNNIIIQILSEKALPFIWLMSTGGDYTFHYVKGYGTGQNKTAVHGPGIAANTRHISIVKVRKNGVEAFLDGRPLSKWRTDFTDVSVEPFWLLRDNSLIGLATGDAKTVFHAVEVKEITDKGKFTR
jgi:hypothetical protein